MKQDPVSADDDLAAWLLESPVMLHCVWEVDLEEARAVSASVHQALRRWFPEAPRESLDDMLRTMSDADRDGDMRKFCKTGVRLFDRLDAPPVLPAMRAKEGLLDEAAFRLAGLWAIVPAEYGPHWPPLCLWSDEGIVEFMSLCRVACNVRGIRARRKFLGLVQPSILLVRGLSMDRNRPEFVRPLIRRRRRVAK